MYELLNIQVKDGKQLVSARELHSFLEVKRHFTDWIKPYVKEDNDYGFDEMIDFTRVHVGVNPTNNVPVIDYAITIEMAKELSMLSKTNKGKAARKYFIQCEKLSHALTAYYLDEIKELAVRLDRTEKLIGLRSKDTMNYGAYIKNKMGISKANLDYQNVKMVLFAELGVCKWEQIDYSLDVISKIEEVLDVMKLNRQMSI